MAHPSDGLFDAFETTTLPPSPSPSNPIRSNAKARNPYVVTGASGLVGTHLCSLLVRKGWKVRAIVRDHRKGGRANGPSRAGAYASGDIRDRRLNANRRWMVPPALWCISLQSPSRNGARATTQTNTDATRWLLDAARKPKAVERIVYMSQNGADSRSPYPFPQKQRTRRRRGHFEQHAKWTVLRPSVIFGPEDEFVNVLARLVRLSPLRIPSSGRRHSAISAHRSRRRCAGRRSRSLEDDQHNRTHRIRSADRCH